LTVRNTPADTNNFLVATLMPWQYESDRIYTSLLVAVENFHHQTDHLRSVWFQLLPFLLLLALDRELLVARASQLFQLDKQLLALEFDLACDLVHHLALVVREDPLKLTIKNVTSPSISTSFSSRPLYFSESH